MKILICDDEAPARLRLRQLINEIDDIEVVAEAKNGKEALQRCHELEPDVVLLDIRMPGIDGIETARHLAEHDDPPAVIFTTAYGDFALSAFEANAVDYLLKPLRRERLQQALLKAHSLNKAQLQSLLVDDDFSAARTHLSIHGRDSLLLIAVEDVISFQADHKYVTVHHIDGETLIEESLVSLEQEFSAQFLRIHRNALIAGDKLMGIEKDSSGQVHAIVEGLAEHPEVSRRHVSELRKLLKKRPLKRSFS